MRVLVIDQCSGSKEVPEWFTPYTAEEIDSHTRDELLNDVRERVPSLRAEKLYTGRQQQFISEACNRLRSAGDEVDRVFISAGFGVVDETAELPPYEVTFDDYSSAEVRERGEELEIGSDLDALLTNEPAYDVVFFALGRAYLESFDLPEVLSDLPSGTIGVVFNQEKLAEEHDRVRSLSARTEDAKEFGTIVVAVKGQYIQNFAAHREQGEVPESAADVVSCCETTSTTQSTLDGV